MATTSLVAERIAKSVAALPTTELRRARALIAAGLISKGRIGGAGKKDDFDDQALAYMALGQSGTLPSDAPSAVQRLRNLIDHDSGETLLDYVVGQIRVAATVEGRARLVAEIQAGEATFTPSRELILAPDAPIAWESVYADRGGSRFQRHFTRAKGTTPSHTPSTVRRLTTISLGLFVVLGDLYADALAKRAAASDPEPGLGLSEGAPTPQNNDAGYPSDGAPASCQPNSRPTDGFPGRRKDARREKILQGQRVGLAGDLSAPSHGVDHVRRLPLCAAGAAS